LCNGSQPRALRVEGTNRGCTKTSKFGAPIEGLSAKDFAEPDNFFRMGTPPVMVDIMPKISGVEFEAAWIRRVAQDLVDVDALRESNQSQEIERQQPSAPGRVVEVAATPDRGEF
jgi:hypothetical protein